jgi:hypothetical protein
VVGLEEPLPHVSLAETPSAPLRIVRGLYQGFRDATPERGDENCHHHGQLSGTAVGPPVGASQCGGAESDG